MSSVRGGERWGVCVRGATLDSHLPTASPESLQANRFHSLSPNLEAQLPLGSSSCTRTATAEAGSGGGGASESLFYEEFLPHVLHQHKEVSGPCVKAGREAS